MTPDPFLDPPAERPGCVLAAAAGAGPFVAVAAVVALVDALGASDAVAVLAWLGFAAALVWGLLATFARRRDFDGVLERERVGRALDGGPRC